MKEPSPTRPLLGVVIPAKDPGSLFESHARSLADLAAVRGGVQVCVVDDGSVRDDVASVAIVHSIGYLRHQVNRGKGAALRSGFTALLPTLVDDDLIGFIDADGDIPATYLFEYAELLEGLGPDTVAVIGSKRLTGSQFTASLRRKVASSTFSKMVSLLMPSSVSDTQVGVKVFRAGFIRSVLPHTVSDGFLLDVELLAAAHRRKMHVVPAPVDVVLGRSTSTISLRSIASMARQLLALSVRHRRGRRLG